MLSGGILTFDDVSDNEELISKMIVFNDCEFEIILGTKEVMILLI